MRLTIALTMTVLGSCWHVKADESRARPDTANLIGAYEIVSGEKGGQKITAERLQGVTVRIAENAITTLDKDKQEVYVATYELDAGRKPWRITMTATITPVDNTPAGGKGTQAEGLIEMEGDAVKLIYALPGGKAPTEFKTVEGQQMFVLKKTGK